MVVVGCVCRNRLSLLLVVPSLARAATTSNRRPLGKNPTSRSLQRTGRPLRPFAPSLLPSLLSSLESAATSSSALTLDQRDPSTRDRLCLSSYTSNCHSLHVTTRPNANCHTRACTLYCGWCLHIIAATGRSLSACRVCLSAFLVERLAEASSFLAFGLEHNHNIHPAVEQHQQTSLASS